MEIKNIQHNAVAVAHVSIHVCYIQTPVHPTVKHRIGLNMTDSYMLGTIGSCSKKLNIQEINNHYVCNYLFCIKCLQHQVLIMFFRAMCIHRGNKDRLDKI